MKIILCLPGNKFSGDFMMNFVGLLHFLGSKNIEYQISQQYSSMVNFARCKCAGADVTRGKRQKPFNGLDYDYMMWIDSDIIFNNNLFEKLLGMDKDIASGWYAQPQTIPGGGNYTPVVEKMDDKFFKKHGSYEFLTSKNLEERKKPFKVDYIGFGWVLVKKGVFEKINYPWFAPKLIDLGNGVQDVCSEDVAWCHDVKDAGFDIWLDPTCRAGHEKTFAI
jgi:GT2 family glycosyltransferase